MARMILSWSPDSACCCRYVSPCARKTSATSNLGRPSRDGAAEDALWHGTSLYGVAVPVLPPAGLGSRSSGLCVLPMCATLTWV